MPLKASELSMPRYQPDTPGLMRMTTSISENVTTSTLTIPPADPAMIAFVSFWFFRVSNFFQSTFFFQPCVTGFWALAVAADVVDFAAVSSWTMMADVVGLATVVPSAVVVDVAVLAAPPGLATVAPSAAVADVVVLVGMLLRSW